VADEEGTIYEWPLKFALHDEAITRLGHDLAFIRFSFTLHHVRLIVPSVDILFMHLSTRKHLSTFVLCDLSSLTRT
jgi:hypothetical protein